MKHTRLMALAAACATMAIVTFISSRNVHGAGETVSATVPIYNPYPPGILPSDIASEIQRVRRCAPTSSNPACLSVGGFE
jgi:hypothetical protein